ncbi:DUF4173 domain-containing protein [Hymenobacter sp. ASUV-10]|uniref:DUF4173 domain-containing protein n=1 Tax=Hymenobacter aranciens TaxID=3063996 RepID=A0ABT9BE46_9BACT|nr:DUF4173 domain-containing protein [Hymenobacter sp. ASUV-10]MDO7876540.1 DUF4173 domain-containing protein [Hymenobacter sp. ASUV-10]
MNPAFQPGAAAWPSATPAQPAPLPLTAAQKLLLPLGALLFDWLFWLEGTGLNVLVFTIFVVAAQLYLLPRHAAARRSGYFWLAVAGSLFSAAMVAVYGSGAAGLATLASLAMLLGYVNQPHLKLVLYAVLTAGANWLQAGPRVLRGLRAPRQSGAGLRRGWFYARLLLVPLAVLVGFHLLFAMANPRYDMLSYKVMAKLMDWLLLLIPDISFAHLLFFALGFLLTAGALVVVPVHYFADHESRFGEFIRRQRDRVASFGVRRPDFSAKNFRTLDLRKEFLAAGAVFGLVNLLLLVVNAIDINWLWFGFVPKANFDLAQFVHEGTYVLIFSILLAMGIVLWFFRRNLNFYQPGLPWLRWGATVWVLQNAVLAISVGLRNYYYIWHSGIAYKRIGVCFFLVLVFFGLATVLLKIWQRRSAYSLIRLNSLAVYAVLLALAAGNWEPWIAGYNLQRRFPSLDIGFLLDMPGRVLPVLQARRAVIAEARQLNVEDENGNVTSIDNAAALARLDMAIRDWQAHHAARPDWQSLTWAAYQTAEALPPHE